MSKKKICGRRLYGLNVRLQKSIQSKFVATQVTNKKAGQLTGLEASLSELD